MVDKELWTRSRSGADLSGGIMLATDPSRTYRGTQVNGSSRLGTTVQVLASRRHG
jgi:hypothetical protein